MLHAHDLTPLTLLGLVVLIVIWGVLELRSKK